MPSVPDSYKIGLAVAAVVIVVQGGVIGYCWYKKRLHEKLIK